MLHEQSNQSFDIKNFIVKNMMTFFHESIYYVNDNVVIVYFKKIDNQINIDVASSSLQYK